ncbi:MAG: hypothetical protein M3P06_03780 [Acidobacteriota bacterium]|nr:hypothetical protein [Acidobacteriota bacterium]
MTPNAKPEPGTAFQGEVANLGSSQGTPVQITQSGVTYFLSITELNGCCVLTAYTTDGPLPTNTWVALYPGMPPSNPNAGYLSNAWFYLAGSKSLQTTYPFGTGFFAAIVTCTNWNCESGRGLYSYALQVGPT